MYQGKHIKIDDFSGGYCGNLSPSALKNNQASDLDQIIITPGGGFRLRNTHSGYNSTSIDTARVTGIGHFKTSSGTQYFVTVVGTKIYLNNISAGTPNTWSDKTGAVTIGTPGNSMWTLFPFNSRIIGFGGTVTTPNTPWEIDPTSGNAAVLTGTPPDAYGGLAANNRVFAFGKTSALSTLYWTILGNENDWTGAGSGSAVIGSATGEGGIQAAAVLNANTLLVFKNSKTYQVVLTTAPFPSYSLFGDQGCVGKHAVINIGGTVYWINQYKRMVSTDGNGLQEYPPNANDLFDTISIGQETNILGFHQKGTDFDWIVWNIDTTGNGNSYAIIWDLLNKCWLKCSTGYNFQSAVVIKEPGLLILGSTYCGTARTDAAYVIQAGGRLGSVNTTDASSGTTPAPYWRSGWIQPQTEEEIIQVSRVTVTCKPLINSVSLSLITGFNYIADSTTTAITAAATSTETYEIKRVLLTGRGNVFQFKLGVTNGNPDTNNVTVSNIILSGKVYGQKRASAS